MAAVQDLIMFKVDITAAYMNTPMCNDIKYKWMMLDKDVAAILVAMDKVYWESFNDVMGIS